MRIGEASKASGVPERMVRHYEKLGLIPPAPRRSSGYRDYSDADVARLTFIAQARSVGVSLDEIAGLLGADASTRSRLVERWRAMLEAKAAEVRSLMNKVEIM